MDQAEWFQPAGRRVIKQHSPAALKRFHRASPSHSASDSGRPLPPLRSPLAAARVQETNSETNGGATKSFLRYFGVRDLKKAVSGFHP